MTRTQPGQRRNPAPVILGCAAALLAVYYLIIGWSGVLDVSTDVPFTGENDADTSSYVTLKMSVSEIDLTNRVMDATVLPVPHGSLVGPKPGEISGHLRIEVLSGGETTSVLAFPDESIIDPTSITLLLDRGDTAYPFDAPFADFRLRVADDVTGETVPFVIDFTSSARPWQLTGIRGEVTDGGQVPITLQGSRDALSITLVLAYVLTILVTTLMAVVIIGAAILTRTLDFANVIWLSATLLSFPAMRSAMPGAPPIGTALDFIVLFPCLAMIALMMLWTGAHMIWRESTLLRRRTLVAESSPTTAMADVKERSPASVGEDAVRAAR